MSEVQGTTPLSAQQIRKMEAILDRRPEMEAHLIAHLRRRGFDTRALEGARAPLQLGKEAAGFGRGLRKAVGLDPQAAADPQEAAVSFGSSRIPIGETVGRLVPEALGVMGGTRLLKQFPALFKGSTIAREAVREGVGGLVGGAAEEVGPQLKDPNVTLGESFDRIVDDTITGGLLGAAGATVFTLARSGIRKLKSQKLPDAAEAEALRTAAQTTDHPELASQLDIALARQQPPSEQTAGTINRLVGEGSFPQANDPFRSTLPVIVHTHADDIGVNPLKAPTPGQGQVPADPILVRLGQPRSPAPAPGPLGAGPPPPAALPPSPLVQPAGVVQIDDMIMDLAPTLQTGRVSLQEAGSRIETAFDTVVPDYELSQALTHATMRGAKGLERGDISAHQLQLFTRDVLLSKNKAEAMEKIRTFAPDPDDGPNLPANPVVRFMGRPKVTAQSLDAKLEAAQDLETLERLVVHDIPAGLENGSLRLGAANTLIARAARKGSQLQPGQTRLTLGGLRGSREQIVIRLKNGEELSGDYQGVFNERTYVVKTAQGTVHIDAADVADRRIFTAVGGGADPLQAIPATTQQVRKYFALVDEIQRRGGDVGKVQDATRLSRQQASEAIGELERQRAKLQAQASDALLDEVDAAKAKASDDVLATGEPATLDVNDPNALGPEWYRDSSWGYARGLRPEMSRGGMLAHEGGRQVYELGQTMQRNVVKRSHAFLERLKTTTAPLSGPQKYRVVRALDGDTTQLSDPQVQQAVAGIRPVLDEIADLLGLERGQRIRHYFPHMFEGKMGLYRAIALTQELGTETAEKLGLRAGAIDRILGRYDVEAGIPLQKFFGNVLERYGLDGYQMDLDKVLHTYVTGAIRKLEGDRYLDQATTILRKIPTRDLQGRPLQSRRFTAEHIAWAVGQPLPARTLLAKAFADSPVFNGAVDRLVELVGGAPERGLMTKARTLELLAQKMTNNTATKAEIAQFHNTPIDDSLAFLKKLHADAATHLKGVKQTPSIKRARSRAALALNDFRNAINNPLARGIVASFGYRMMLLGKLGFNLSHFLINLTQTVTNTFPLLGLRHVTDGIAGLWNKQKAMLGGRSAQQILDDSGVVLDPVEFGEFTGRSGRFNRLSELALTGTRKSEEWNRSIAILGGYVKFLKSKNIQANQRIGDTLHQQALDFGVKQSDTANFPFNRAGTPRLFRSAGAKLAFQFMTYPLHQMNFTGELLHDALTAAQRAQGASGKVQAFAASPFMKQMLAYSVLFGLGSYSNTQLWERTRHPAWDLVAKLNDDTFGGQDPSTIFFGPAADALVQAASGHYRQALHTAASGPALTAARQAAGLAGISDEPFDPQKLVIGSLFDAPPTKKRRSGGPSPFGPSPFK